MATVHLLRRIVPAAFVVGWLVSPLTAQVGGVYIDAAGMLRETATLAPDDRLDLVRRHLVGQAVSDDVAAESALRKVSLARLEARVQALREAGQDLPADVEYLAGLTAVRYVFFDAAGRDVIVAGPAEGWTLADSGEVVGVRSNRPVLHLDDLIVALRYAFAREPFGPPPYEGGVRGGDGDTTRDLARTPPGPPLARGRTEEAGFIGCSIEPTAEGVTRYASYMRKLSGIDRSQPGAVFAGMEQAMGPQDVKLYGVDGSSRFALVMVAADYRLKRIALGHDPSPVRDVVNYLDLCVRRFNRRAVSRQHRWWFTAGYDAVYHTPDELAFELSGHGVKVVTAQTLPGQADDDDTDEPSSPNAKLFAETFTRHFEDVAEKVPVFQELQNLIGLATLAELIAEKFEVGPGDDAPATWRPRHFLDEDACPIARYPVPKMVPSLANFRLAGGRHWIISISGGVEIQPRELTARRVRKAAPDGSLTELHGHAVSRSGEGWWWD
ncbi:MAG: DUF1598 domain-containing protein [Planctomycetes bacterium]|nr:DUF1598 domain-containing protein [Planctomycetota bacterium]